MYRVWTENGNKDNFDSLGDAINFAVGNYMYSDIAAMIDNTDWSDDVDRTVAITWGGRVYLRDDYEYHDLLQTLRAQASIAKTHFEAAQTLVNFLWWLYDTGQINVINDDVTEVIRACRQWGQETAVSEES